MFGTRHISLRKQAQETEKLSEFLQKEAVKLFLQKKDLHQQLHQAKQQTLQSQSCVHQDHEQLEKALTKAGKSQIQVHDAQKLYDLLWTEMQQTKQR